MPSTLSLVQIETLLPDPWTFLHDWRPVQVPMIFEEPERVVLMAVGGTSGAVIQWVTLADLLHADARGSDMADRAALAAYLGQILDNPTAFGEAPVDSPAARTRARRSNRV